MSSVVYYIASTLYPAPETCLPEAILPDDAALDAAYHIKDTDDIEQSSSMGEKASLQAEVKSTVDNDA